VRLRCARREEVKKNKKINRTRTPFSDRDDDGDLKVGGSVLPVGGEERTFINSISAKRRKGLSLGDLSAYRKNEKKGQ
jgi:hypothetical protein